MIGSALSSCSLRICGEHQSVHLGHVHVSDHRGRSGLLLEPADGFEGVLCFARDHSPFPGLEGEDAAVGGVIVHDQGAFALQRRLDALDVAGGFRSAMTLPSSARMVKIKQAP